MIKSLISQLSSDKVLLSTALRKSKIIARHSNDHNLSLFLNLELNGYDVSEPLPAYRIVHVIPKGTFRNEWTNEKQTITLTYEDGMDRLAKLMYQRDIIIPIPQLEDILQSHDNKGNLSIGQIFPNELVNMIRDQLSNDAPWYLESGQWVIQRNVFSNIISQTKDKLIDALWEILHLHPELEKELDFMLEEHQGASKTYLTTINGNVSGSNFGIADKLVQKDITIHSNSEIQKLFETIITLGFKQADVNELAVLVEEKRPNDLSTKLFEWLSKMTLKAAQVGLESQIPTLIAKISEFIHSSSR